MAALAKEFRLLLEPFSFAGAEAARPTALAALSVPVGVSYLTVAPGEPPRLEQEAPHGVLAFALEPVSSRGLDHLLLLGPAHHSARCNGLPLQRLALLAVRDQLQLGDHVLHVTLFHRPRLGPPPVDFLGRECPVCRLALVPETRVFLCPHCDTPLHCEGEEKPVEERLECVRLGTECPTCHRPIVLQEGYAYLPEVHGG